MGSGFMTFEEAANRLGRSKRSIHNYVKQGLLQRVMNSGNVVLRKEDVEQLAVDIGSDSPALNRKTFYLLQARLKKLEEEMVAVKHILEIRDSPLRPSESEARGLYAAATESLSRRNWVAEEVDLWAAQFERLDEPALDSISQAIQDNKAWTPFFTLCLELIKYAHSRFSTEKVDPLLWLARHKRLEEGRKKLRGSILIWIEAGRGSVSEPFLTSLEGGKEAVLRRLTLVGGKKG